MSTVVIGADGFMGRHLTAQLVKEGKAELTLVCHRPTDGYLQKTFPSVRVVKANLTDLDQMVDISRSAETVFQLAWSTTPHSSNVDPVADCCDNVLGHLRFIDALTPHFKGRLVFVSSGGAVYGIPQVLPIPESHPIHPLSSYGISKSVVERYLELYGRLHGLDYTIMRVANPYGPGQTVKNAQGVIPAILLCVKTGQAFTMWGDGSVIRDYVHVRDVAAALSLAGNHKNAARQTFNIGSGKGESLCELIELVERISKRKILIHRMPARKEDVPVSQLDVTKAMAYLDWSPGIKFEEGLRELINGSP